MKEPKLDAGTEIRFTTGPLGCINPQNPGRVADETVQLGDTGQIVAAELEAMNYHEGYNRLEGWIFVRPDKYPELLIPVHQAMVEARVGATA
jgi:hypothetical protein